MSNCSTCSVELPTRAPGAKGRPRSVCDACKLEVKRRCDRESKRRTDRGSCASCGGRCQRQSSVCKACYFDLGLQRRPHTNPRPKAPSPRCIVCDVGVAKGAYRCLSCGHAELLNLHVLLGLVEHPRAESLRRVSARRKARELAAPGYFNTYRRRKVLLDRWVRQGRACFYCERPAESVDHVVALTLGGSNHEGNLVPACTSCNAAKSNNLLIAWRSGRTGRPYAGRSVA